MEAINPLVDRWLRDGADDPDAFWERAARSLPWFRGWDTVFEWDFPEFRWFSGAETNLAYNCVDRHAQGADRGRAALVYVNERGDRTVLTYAQLQHQVGIVAAALRGMGIRKGDRLTIYMPVCIESIVLMLATVRIGAIHSVVFAGFGAEALRERIRASGSKLVFTTDITYRKGADIRLKYIVDDSVTDAESPVTNVILLKRGEDDVPMTMGRDLSWEEFIARGEGQSSEFARMEANEPAFILATSGTTAKPKLVVHTHGGYQVGVHSMAQWCFGMKPTDVWWATSDIGWIVGHSYIVYAPLLMGCTTIAYEGAFDYPNPDLVWSIVDEFGVTGIFTSPTAVRLLTRYGDDAMPKSDLDSLERVFCAGEVLNPPAWEWLQKEALGNRIPVIDHYWQTETGGPIVGNPYGLSLLPIKPGSAAIPLPGIDVGVMTLEGEECGPDEKGILTIKRPFPSLTPTLWGETDRYATDYWTRVPGRRVYFAGDSAHIDEDGYVWFAGRADEVIKIAAHRIGTVEVESALLTHSAVAEAGVTARPDEIRGEVISAFTVLKGGFQPSEELRRELIQTVRRNLGPIAVIGELNFVDMLPKTRSGKIMRRVLKAVVLDQEPGDITTIEDEGSVEDARQAWQQMKAAAKNRV